MYPGKVARPNRIPIFVIAIALVVAVAFAAWAIAQGYTDLKDREVTSSGIADGTVAAADLEDSAVTSPKIAKGAVGTAPAAPSPRPRSPMAPWPPQTWPMRL